MVQYPEKRHIEPYQTPTIHGTQLTHRETLTHMIGHPDNAKNHPQYQQPVSVTLNTSTTSQYLTTINQNILQCYHHTPHISKPRSGNDT